jgi:Flp pilus assembly pilin Flp
MHTRATESWKEILGQTRRNAVWTAGCWLLFGGEAAEALWKPHGSFYPFALLLWGVLAAFWSFLMVSGLGQLSHAIKSEESQTMRSAARRVTRYVFCAAILLWLFAGSVIAATLFGRLYVVAAVALGILAIAMVFTIEREFRSLSRRFSHLSEEQLASRV